MQDGHNRAIVSFLFKTSLTVQASAVVHAVDDHVFCDVRLAVLVTADDHLAVRADVDRVHHAARDEQQPKGVGFHMPFLTWQDSARKTYGQKRKSPRTMQTMDAMPHSVRTIV